MRRLLVPNGIQEFGSQHIGATSLHGEIKEIFRLQQNIVRNCFPRQSGQHHRQLLLPVH